jgi:hypothetical protein
MGYLDVRLKMKDGSTKNVELVRSNKKTAVVRLPHKDPEKGFNYIKVDRSRILA